MSRTVNTLIISIAAVAILVYGESILLPFVLAVLIWFLIKVVRNAIKKIKIGGKEIPTLGRNMIAVLSIFSVLALVGKMLASNVASIQGVLPEYEANLLSMSLSINDYFGIDISAWLHDYTSGNAELGGFIKSFAQSVTELMGNTFMVTIYVLFLMLEESVFDVKLKAIFKDESKFEQAQSVLTKINESIVSYISLKTMVSLITGVASYVVLLIIGVDFAFLWAFLIFVLNFIPTVGSLLATVFPVLIAVMQFTTFGPVIAVAVSIGLIQVLVGNILEPKIMGDSLNISSLTVILALTFWGTIWGVVGMILSVPITVILIILFAQFENTRSAAVLLSANGKV